MLFFVYPHESNQWLLSICSKVYECLSDDKMPQHQNSFEFVWPNPWFLLFFSPRLLVMQGRGCKGSKHSQPDGFLWNANSTLGVFYLLKKTCNQEKKPKPNPKPEQKTQHIYPLRCYFTLCFFILPKFKKSCWIFLKVMGSKKFGKYKFLSRKLEYNIVTL